MDPNESRRRFFDDLLHMVGEVPVETIVAKIKAAIGNDAGDIREVMGYFAFMARSAGQSDDPLELRARDRMLDVLVKLGMPKGEGSLEERGRRDRLRRLLDGMGEAGLRCDT